MRNIVLIFLTVITLNSCSLDKDYGWKYNIIDNRGIIYHANFYNETGDGCILFNDEPGKDNIPGTPVMLCGNYSVIQVKK